MFSMLSGLCRRFAYCAAFHFELHSDTRGKIRRELSPAYAMLELAPPDAHHNGSAVGAMAREVDVIQRSQKRRRLLSAHCVTGSQRSVAGHGGQCEIDSAR